MCGKEPNAMNDVSVGFSKCLKKLIHALLIELALGFERGKFFSKKSDHFQIQLLSIHIVCDAEKFAIKVVFERYSADRKISIETIKEDMEIVLLKSFESDYQDDSFVYAFNDDSRIPGFNYEEPNTMLDSWIDFHN